MVKNIFEDELRRLIPRIYELKPELCRCEQCTEDLLALALQKLPPKYVSRPVGEVYARLELESVQAQVDMIEALLQAADVVIANPRCGRKTGS